MKDGNDVLLETLKDPNVTQKEEAHEAAVQEAGVALCQDRTKTPSPVLWGLNVTHEMTKAHLPKNGCSRGSQRRDGSDMTKMTTGEVPKEDGEMVNEDQHAEIAGRREGNDVQREESESQHAVSADRHVAVIA